MFTLTGEDIVKICEMIRDSENFEYIILDMNFEVSENIVLPFINSNMVILVTDGSEIGNYKTDCFISLLPIMLNSRETDISSKTRILYNRFDRNKGMAIIQNTTKPENNKCWLRCGESRTFKIGRAHV